MQDYTKKVQQSPTHHTTLSRILQFNGTVRAGPKCGLIMRNNMGKMTHPIICTNFASYGFTVLINYIIDCVNERHPSTSTRRCRGVRPLLRISAGTRERLAGRRRATARRHKVNARVSTVLAFLEGPVLRSFSPKRLRTGPGPVLKFTINLNGSTHDWL